MASPTVGSTSSSSVITNQNAHAVTLPASISAGDLLVVMFGAGSTGTVFGSIQVDIGASGKQWFKFPLQSTAGRNGIIVFAKIAEGSDALTVLTQQQCHSVHEAYRITGHGSALWQATTDAASATNADPPNCATTVAAQDLLAITYCVLNGTIVASVAPTGYASLLTKAGDASGCSMSSATKALTSATSENPGAFTNAASASASGTILVASTSITVNARPTQEAVEVLSDGTPNAVMTQEAVEVLSQNALNAIMTQEAVEVLSSNDGSTRGRRVIIIGT